MSAVYATYGERWGLMEWSFLLLPFLLPGGVLIPYAIRRFRDASRLGGAEPPRLRVAGHAALTVLAYLGAAFLLAAFFSKPYFSARAVARSAECMDDLRHLSSAALLYAHDWDDTLPPAAEWHDLTPDYLPHTVADRRLRCPSTDAPFTYGFNLHLDRLPFSRLDAPGDTVLLFESNSTVPNAAGDRSAVAVPRRHFSTTNYALADGRVTRANDPVDARLRWLPAAEPGPSRVDAVGEHREP